MPIFCKFKALVFLSLLIYFGSSIVQTVSAQLYPVQSTSQLIPPYSVYLSDYAAPGNEKLRVILVQRDLTQPSYQLRLVMSVELNGKVILRTSRTYNPPPISLNPGIPTIISGAEIAPYLDSRNIDFVGYSREQYEKTRALPEGSYQLTFTAYDYRRQDVQVSNAGTSFYYLSKNEPPLINFPACGAALPMRTPQQIVFSWLARNTSSPNSAAETQYEFELFETRPAGRNPNDVVLSTQPVFKTTVDYTQLIYGPAEPLLLENMKYVWRVRAVDREGRDAFRNNGYSEVCTFTYGGVDPNFDIGIVKGLQAEGETERRAKIWWTTGAYDAYRVNYRKTGNGSYEWFTSEVTTQQLTAEGKTDGDVKLFDLEPDTEYETRIQGKKSGILGGYTEIVKFRTQPMRIAQCGDPTPLPKAPGNPYRNALIGETMNVDGMDLTLSEITNLGDGYYAGIGKVSLPYLGGASFAVKFSRIFINTDRIVEQGRIDFVTKGVAAMVEQQMSNAKLNAQNKVQKENREAWAGTEFYGEVFLYDQMEIDKITPGGASLVNIYDTEGNVKADAKVMQVLNSVPGKAIIIQDKSGDQFVVQKDKVTGEVKATKVDGGGLMVGNDGQMMSEKDIRNLRRLIIAALKEFKTAIEDYQASSETNDPNRGGEKSLLQFNLAMFAANLPACLEAHKHKLGVIESKIDQGLDSTTNVAQEIYSSVIARITENGVFNTAKVKDAVCEALVENLMSVEELMQKMPNYFGQRILRPNGKTDNTHEDAVLIQDENDQTIAYILPDEKIFFWINDGKWQGYFENGLKTQKGDYLSYVDDKFMRRDEPISWGIYLAARDLGGFAIDLVDAPIQTSKNLATGLYKIATLQFDMEKTWQRIITADKTDGAYVVATLAMGYLAGPKCKKIVPAEDLPRFQEMLGEYATKLQPVKLTWPQILALFKKARQFEALITTHLKALYPIEKGFHVLKQVYVKVDGVMSIADNIIFDSKTGQFILNETKYGLSNLLRKNQQVIQDAIKAGKQLEIRTAENFVVNGQVIFSQGSKIRISKILRSNSVDGVIGTNTVKTIWP